MTTRFIHDTKKTRLGDQEVTVPNGAYDLNDVSSITPTGADPATKKPYAVLHFASGVAQQIFQDYEATVTAWQAYHDTPAAVPPAAPVTPPAHV